MVPMNVVAVMAALMTLIQGAESAIKDEDVQKADAALDKALDPAIRKQLDDELAKYGKFLKEKTEQAAKVNDIVGEFKSKLDDAIKTAIDAAVDAATTAFQKSLDKSMKTATKHLTKKSKLDSLPSPEIRKAVQDALSMTPAADAFAQLLPSKTAAKDILSKAAKAAEAAQQAAAAEVNAAEASKKKLPDASAPLKDYYATIVASCLKDIPEGTTVFDYFCTNGESLKNCVLGEGDTKPIRLQVWRYFEDEGIRKCQNTGDNAVPSLCNLTEEMRGSGTSMKVWDDAEGYVKYYFSCRNWSAIMSSKLWIGCSDRPKPNKTTSSAKLSKDTCSIVA